MTSDDYEDGFAGPKLGEGTRGLADPPGFEALWQMENSTTVEDYVRRGDGLLVKETSPQVRTVVT